MKNSDKLERCKVLLKMIEKKTSYVRDCEIRIMNEHKKDKIQSFLLVSESYLRSQISNTESQITWLKDRFNKTIESINKF